MPKNTLVCVGACAIDNILTVPHFPEEDSKLRATFFTRRRGGNTSNSLEVLQQLLDDDHDYEDRHERDDTSSDLYLIAPLPARHSTDTKFITASFDPPVNGQRSRVNLSHCIYREEASQAVTSYIISSQATSSRTIINNNALPEMTLEEFQSSAERILEECSDTTKFSFHFEGRIPETTLECMRWLRKRLPSKEPLEEGTSNTPGLEISVELEKPGREGLQDLAYEADTVFYSKAWAKGQSYDSAETCLLEQIRIFTAAARNETPRSLICTWGEQGAASVSLIRSLRHGCSQVEWERRMREAIHHRPAFVSKGSVIVDSTGAGDTFIAGMLYCRLSTQRSSRDERKVWTRDRELDFANGLAGNKILRNGFHGMGDVAKTLRRRFDLEDARGGGE